MIISKGSVLLCIAVTFIVNFETTPSFGGGFFFVDAQFVHEIDAELPNRVQLNHNKECNTVGRSPWLFCEDFERDNEYKYIEARNRAQERKSGVGLMASFGLYTKFRRAERPSKSIIKVGFGKVPDPAFNPTNAGSMIAKQINMRFYLKYGKGWQPVATTIAALGSVCSTRWQEAMRVAITVDDDGYISLQAFTGFDATLESLVSQSFDDGRLIEIGKVTTIENVSDFAERWQLFELQVQLESQQGAADGTATLWLNNRVIAELKNAAYYQAQTMLYGVNVAYLNSTLQRAIHDDQSMTFDNLIVSRVRIGEPGVVEGESLPNFTEEKIIAPHIPDAENDLPQLLLGTLDLTGEDNHRAVLATCWHGNLPVLLMDEACHLAWLYQLQTALMITFDSRPISPPPPTTLKVPHTGADGRGVVQIRFADAQDAYFRTCDDPYDSSFRAELLAYHIDRLLGINRIPATVMRVVTEKEVKDGYGNGDVFRALRACAATNRELFVGSLSGWPHENLAGIDVNLNYVRGIEFRSERPSAAELELTRLIISLLINGVPRKILTDNIVEVAEAGKGQRNARRILVNANNALARWDYWNPSKVTSHCSRSLKERMFHCHDLLPGASIVPPPTTTTTTKLDHQMLNAKETDSNNDEQEDEEKSTIDFKDKHIFDQLDAGSTNIALKPNNNNNKQQQHRAKQTIDENEDEEDESVAPKKHHHADARSDDDDDEVEVEDGDDDDDEENDKHANNNKHKFKQQEELTTTTTTTIDNDDQRRPKRLKQQHKQQEDEDEESEYESIESNNNKKKHKASRKHNNDGDSESNEDEQESIDEDDDDGDVRVKKPTRGKLLKRSVRVNKVDDVNSPGTAAFVAADNEAAGHLLSHLRTSCNFPRSVAARLSIYAFGKDLSLSDALARVAHRDVATPIALKRYRPQVLDARVDAIYSVLLDCSNKYGVRHVVFDDEEFDQVNEPPPLHIDPAGQRYLRNATSGVWYKVDEHNNPIAASRIAQTANDEQQKQQQQQQQQLQNKQPEWARVLEENIEADAEADNSVEIAQRAHLACQLRSSCRSCVSTNDCNWCLGSGSCLPLEMQCKTGVQVTRYAGCRTHLITGANGVIVDNNNKNNNKAVTKQDNVSPTVAASLNVIIQQTPPPVEFDYANLFGEKKK